MNLMHYLPIVTVLKTYNTKKFQTDLVAGLTTTIMIIPQGMAYALLAGLPAHVGLYASTIPLLAYAVLGTSRTLAVGPTAIDSLLTATVIGTICTTGTDRYLEMCALLALMVGGIQGLLGILRAGFIVRLLSLPVIKGFTSAAALIIAINQLKLVLGISLARSTYLFDIIGETVIRFAEINIVTVIIAFCSFVALVGLKKIKPRFPRALFVVGFGAVFVYVFSLDEYKVDVIGQIPSGLPSLMIPRWTTEDVFSLLPGALMIAVVAFMEAISISNSLLREGEKRPLPNRELIGVGSANILSGVFQGLPVTGGFSRSAVNSDAGVETQFAGIITAVSVSLCLIFLTPFLYFIPKAVLGAIIITSALGLVEVREPIKYWRTHKNDFYVLLGTFVSTLMLGIQQGIVIGVLLGLFSHVVHQSKQAIVTVIKPGEIRLGPVIFFANIDDLTEQFSLGLGEQKHLVIDASDLRSLDMTGQHHLLCCLQKLEDTNITYELKNLRLDIAKRLSVKK
jgi:sulfate permease, SulP family